MKRLMLALLPSILLAFVAFIAPVGAADANVSIDGFGPPGYSPASVTINVGDKVTWKNDHSSPHTVTANDGSFDSGNINPGGTFPRTFTATGTFTYRCNFHPATMAGSVTVQGGGGTQPPPPPATTPPVSTKPSASPSPTKAASASPSPSPSASKAASPTPSASATGSSPATVSGTSGPTGTVVAKSSEKEKKDDDGLGIGAIIAIVASILAAGSAAGLWYLRKTPA